MSGGKMISQAYWPREDEWISGSVEDFFPFFDGKKHVISLVGGGGKSTLLAYLAERFAVRGMRTAVMTTTRTIFATDICQSIEACRVVWARGEYAACGEKLESGKYCAPHQALLAQLLKEAEIIIVEADGAHMLACKAPAEHEPVILPESDIVIGVMGLEVMGCAVGEVCHRPRHVCALLGCEEDHRLTAQDMAAILASDKGARKNVGSRDFYAVLNKCDDEERLAHGRQVLDALGKQVPAVLTRFARC